MKRSIASLKIALSVGIACLQFNDLRSEDEVEIALQRSIPKSDFYLIVGAQIAQTKKNVGTLVGVERDTLIVRSGTGGIQKVASKSLEDLQVNRDLVLSASFIEIDRLIAERTFTPKNDPNRIWAAQTSKAISVNTYMGDQAYYRASILRDTPSPVPRPVYSLEDEQKRDEEKAKYEKIERASIEATRHYVDSRVYNDELREAAKIDPSAFDALKLTFQATPTRTLKNVYAVIIAEYREPTEPVTSRHTWIQFSEIGDLEPKVNLLRIRGGGLPPGYTLLGVKLHLYENGSEIATNASDQCAPLKWADALKYLRVVHLSTHKTNTVPASVATALLPRSFGSEIPASDLKRRVRVSVDNTGTAVEYTPLDGAGPISTIHLSYLRQLGFLPALIQGKPTEGTVELSLAELRPKTDA